MSSATDLELAGIVQHALLPTRCPQGCPCTVTGARWIPYDPVGGDFYGLPLIADRYRGIVIGDTVGHGISAAILMAIMCGTIRGCSAFAHRPVRLVQRLNRDLAEFASHAPNRPDLFLASLFYGVLDFRSRRFRYVNAGHPPPLLRRKNGQTQALTATGTLLGVDEKITYTEIELVIDPLDRLVLVTDGILEARNRADTLFGTERVKDLVNDCDAGTPQQCADTLVDRVATFREGLPAEDDQTVMVVDFR
jgi:phosphoserine phosphatase RsbU/P